MTLQKMEACLEAKLRLIDRLKEGARRKPRSRAIRLALERVRGEVEALRKKIEAERAGIDAREFLAIVAFAA